MLVFEEIPAYRPRLTNIMEGVYLKDTGPGLRNVVLESRSNPTGRSGQLLNVLHLLQSLHILHSNSSMQGLHLKKPLLCVCVCVCVCGCVYLDGFSSIPADRPVSLEGHNSSLVQALTNRGFGTISFIRVY